MFRVIPLLVLSYNAAISHGSSPMCPLPPFQARTGHQASVHVAVYFCHQRNSTASSICKLKLGEATLRKGILTALRFDRDKHDLAAKFYGLDICVSYRSLNLSKTFGETVHGQRSTSCKSKCFTGTTALPIEYDSICDNTECLTYTQNLRFVVRTVTNSKSQTIHRNTESIRTLLFRLAVVFLVWLKTK